MASVKYRIKYIAEEGHSMIARLWELFPNHTWADRSRAYQPIKHTEELQVWDDGTVTYSLEAEDTAISLTELEDILAEPSLEMVGAGTLSTKIFVDDLFRQFPNVTFEEDTVVPMWFGQLNTYYRHGSNIRRTAAYGTEVVSVDYLEFCRINPESTAKASVCISIDTALRLAELKQAAEKAEHELYTARQEYTELYEMLKREFNGITHPTEVAV